MHQNYRSVALGTGGPGFEDAHANAAGRVTGAVSDLPALAARVRALMSDRDPDAPFLTYQALAKALDLAPPGTIRTVAAALEQTMREDVASGRPMIAALVVSRVGDMPRRGFFDLAVALGRFPDDTGMDRAAWEAECTAVLEQASRCQK